MSRPDREVDPRVRGDPADSTTRLRVALEPAELHEPGAGEDGILALDSSGLVLSVNDAAARMFGRDAAELVGNPIASFLVSQQGADYGERKDGTRFPIALAASTLDIFGQSCRIVSVCDVSETWRAEERRRRAEKLAAIGQLAAGVAHELRNPLTSVRNAWFYLEKKMRESAFLDSDPRIASFADILPAELARCARIIGDLLDFSRERPLYRRPTAARELVLSALTVVVKPAATIELVAEVPADLPLANLDVDQFRQVIVNLVQNAAEAVNLATGSVKVRAYGDGDGIGFDVSDDGRGMAPEIQARVFEPLFTTKSRGTGLGLAIVEGIVKRHGGTISVKSRPGAGTTFHLWVPIGEGTEGPAPETGGAADLRMRPAT